ncbi:Mediator of RNA polymerase II transcription subunit 17 [Ceratocystis fimbriata CBS 114723]|uniref:Mediator of RNA polymerase II transcription subunit 17 n=1 Tax=Ceratocystis fimbriata CBS 114723 TaxID=1035309 RepID=A0A2C5X082_9PEZI|nr:Mediator of RNA polymerase II transcription subunit 17 [Ceratocystis fimbriata CBS 114723]
MSDNIPFGLRPWPTTNSNRSPKTVADFIARANAQVPGGFKALSQETLSNRIQSPNDVANSQEKIDEDADMDGSEDDDAEEDDEKIDPAVIKMEILKKIDHAHNCAMITLDFISLLLTKEVPVQAGTTLTQGLREMVGIGTLGSTKMIESNVSAERIQDDNQVGLGWSLMDIDKVSLAAKQSAVTLKKEIEKENKYWESVISVSEAGWNVCRLPNERQTLGVKFGFTTANPQFRNASLAPMRRADDGSAQLDFGKLGGVSQRLLVSLEENGTIIGRSSLPNPVPEDSPLSAHVLEARNTVFAQELWHELILESRQLGSYGVSREASRIVYQTPTRRKVILELANLNDATRDRGSLPHDEGANAINTTLCILLSYAHRHSEYLRSRPFSPTSPPTLNVPNHNLLRPIIVRELHRKAFVECIQYVGAVVKTLHNAGFPESRFIVIASPHKVDEAIHQVSKSERMSLPQAYISALLEPLSFHIRLSLTKNSRLLVGARTYLTPQTTTLYTVIVNDTNLNHPNCLPDIFPPVMQYPTLADLRQLLALAMAYSVTKCCHDTLSHEEKEAKAAAQSTTVPTISAGTSMPSLTGSDDLPLPAYWTHALDNTMLLHRIDLSAGSEAKVSVSAKDIQGADGKFHPQLTVFANLDTPSPEEGSGGRDPDAGRYGADGDTDAKNVSAITTTTMEADDWVSVSVAKPKPLKQGIKTKAREDVIPFAKSVTMTWNEHGGAISDGLGIGGDAGTSGVLEACKKLVRELLWEA